MSTIVKARQKQADSKTTGASLRPNVPSWERNISAIAGGALIAGGLYRRSLPGLALLAGGAALIHRGFSGRCRVYQALGIDRSDYRHRAVGVRAGHGAKTEISIYIHRPAEEVYRYWRDLENLPAVMEHLVSITPMDESCSRWTAQGPLGIELQWDAEIINERTNESLAWRSIPGSAVDTAGSVAFEGSPGGEGTVLHVSLKYDPPGGKLTAAISDFLGAGLSQRLEDDLFRLKQVLEAGEAPTVEGQPRGRCGGSRR